MDMSSWDNNHEEKKQLKPALQASFPCHNETAQMPSWNLDHMDRTFYEFYPNHHK